MAGGIVRDGRWLDPVFWGPIMGYDEAEASGTARSQWVFITRVQSTAHRRQAYYVLSYSTFRLRKYVMAWDRLNWLYSHTSTSHTFGDTVRSWRVRSFVHFTTPYAFSSRRKATSSCTSLPTFSPAVIFVSRNSASCFQHSSSSPRIYRNLRTVGEKA